MKTFKQFQEDEYVHDSSSPEWGFLHPNGTIVNGLEMDGTSHPETALIYLNKWDPDGEVDPDIAMDEAFDELMRKGYVRFAVARNGESLYEFDVKRWKSCCKLIQHYLTYSHYTYGEVFLDIANNNDTVATQKWPNPKKAIAALRVALMDDNIPELWKQNKRRDSLENRYELV